MKKAYYMSGERDELLDDLSGLASRLGDLDAAIYYSRQRVSRGQGSHQVENWERLISMLERGFRGPEVHALRKQLEVKFGQDPDFLRRLGEFYWRNHRLVDAERVLRRRADLLDWDLGSRFDLGLEQTQMGDNQAALSIFELFELVIKQSADIAIPLWAAEGLVPLIDSDSVSPPAEQLERLGFEFETFPLIPIVSEDELATWSKQNKHS